MSYSKLNERLVESFGELEKMCNFVFDDIHGVTCYINKMSENTLSKADKAILKKLKTVRRKRNQLSHGEVLFSDECACEEDIEFLEEFMKSITKCTDPLKLYLPQKKSPDPVKRTDDSASSSSNDVGIGIFAVLAVIVLLCVFFANIGR